MSKRRAWIVWMVVMLTVGVCVAQDEIEARRGAEALTERYQQLYNAGDMQGIADLYVEGGWLSAYGGAYEGREEILGYLREDPPVEGATLAIATEEVIALPSSGVDVDVMGEDDDADVAVTEREPVAVARGTYSLLSPDGERVSGGYWVSANERVQGEWRLRWLITNAEAPATDDSP